MEGLINNYCRLEELFDLVRLHGFQVATVEVEGVVVFVQLHAFSVILHFRKHPVRTLAQRHRNAPARLGLKRLQ